MVWTHSLSTLFLCSLQYEIERHTNVTIFGSGEYSQSLAAASAEFYEEPGFIDSPLGSREQQARTNLTCSFQFDRSFYGSNRHHTLFFFLHAGFIARDANKSMGVENSTYIDHEMEYLLQRFDQVMRGGGHYAVERHGVVYSKHGH